MFCTSINVDPFLSQVADPVIIIQRFGVRSRDGRISPSDNPYRARSMEDAIRFVGQKFASLGPPDCHRKARFQVKTHVFCTEKKDDPPVRVEPVPMIILLQQCDDMFDPTHERDNATTDCIWIAFHFLLRPGGYVYSTSDSQTPFRLWVVTFSTPIPHPPHNYRQLISCPNKKTESKEKN
jgi:hypothetical protein